MYTIISSVKKAALTSSFPICIFFIPSSCLIAEAKSSSTALNRKRKDRNYVLFLILAEIQ